MNSMKMTIRQWMIVGLVLSVVGAGVGYVFDNNYEYGLCYRNDITHTRDTSCNNFYNSIGESLTPGMTALAAVLLILILLPRAFPAWKKFAVWAIPITAFIFLIQPESNSGGFMGGVGFGPTNLQVYKWGSIIFFVLSALIIARAWWKGRKSREQ